MFSALCFLQYHTWRNRMQSRLKRLKNPKYLVGALVGGAYMLFYFGNLLFGTWAMARNGAATAGPSIFGENFGAFLLFVVVVLGWFVPNERAALAFSEAEIAFLFPAPITRRNLIHYKLLRSQVAIFFTVIFLTLISGRWIYMRHIWIVVLGWWIILSTLNLHMLAASFVRTMLLDRGLTTWRRRGLIILLLLAGIGFIALGGWPPFPETGTSFMDCFRDLVAWGKEILVSGNMPYLLYPFRLVVAPFMAQDAGSFFYALGPAAAMLAAHYFLVMRMNVAFEEASVEYSQKLASRIATMRASRIPGAVLPKKAHRPPFRLAPTGHASVAILWKNLLLAGHTVSIRSLFFLAWIVFITSAIFLPGSRHSPGLAVIGVLAGGLLVMSAFIAPNWLRFDFRADLESAELLKMYPIPGWQIVLGEILAPVAIMVVFQWLMVLVAMLFFQVPEHDIPFGLRLGFALAAAVFVPALGLLLFIIPNAATLFFPGWVRFGKEGARGFENLGQMMVLMMGQMLALLASLLPAGLVALLVFLLVNLIASMAVAAPLAALAAALMLFAEAAAAIYFLGKVFERFDISAELST